MGPNEITPNKMSLNDTGKAAGRSKMGQDRPMPHGPRHNAMEWIDTLHFDLAIIFREP